MDGRKWNRQEFRGVSKNQNCETKCRRGKVPQFENSDSLLTIHPDVYNKTNKWDGTSKVIALYIPDSVKVIVQEPIKFAFDSNMRIHSGWNWCWDDNDNWNNRRR